MADRRIGFYRYNSVYCPRRTVKLGFTDIVLFSVRSKFAAGKLDEKILTEAEFGEADTSLRVQGKAPSERREHFPMDVGRHSLRAERATRFGRGEQLASGGACNSLRAGRTGCIGFTDVIRFTVRSSFTCSKTC